MERIISVPNETNASLSRTTRDGRKITYKLKVLQQPERARACGSGAKSSADRRPVDPPPIVELRIYEGEAASEKDITFQLNANYFLFATLEQARPIAQGRVSQDSSRMTVLTGTPVAGMVYLDRPEPAGYFIFPDLSVRHEGKYRLGFSLYEELKEAKDEDRSEEQSATAATGVAEANVTHRVEVKSEPFIVYSAKKFPGLASSTSLSRTVAEQGCRVRIRRDVRMRRREKTGKDYDGYSDGGYDGRSRHSATPDLYQPHMAGAHGMVDAAARERSSSIASHVSLAAAPISRRASVQEMAQGYRQPAYPTQAPGPQTQALPQPSYAAPPPQHYAPQYAQQQPAMPPPQTAYQPYQYAQAPAQPQQQAYYSYAPAPPVHHYEPSHTRNASMDYSIPPPQEIRRATVAHAPSYSYGAPGQSAPQQYAPSIGYSGPQSTSQSRQGSLSMPSASHQMMPAQILPPINTSLQAKEKLEASPPSSAVSTHYYDASKMGSGMDVNRRMSDVPAPVNAKRAYDRVFDSRHMDAPLRQGARPRTPQGRYGGMMADDAESELGDMMRMNYRRADGREIARPLPPSV